MNTQDLSIRGETQKIEQIRDINMQTTLVGSGKTVVLVHGGPGFGYNHLHPAIEYLAGGFNVVTYDQRGSGRSEAGDSDQITFEGQVKDLEELRKKLQLEKLNLIGHSMGAHIALLYGAQFPESIASLVLANAGPPIGEDLMKQFGMQMESRRTSEEKADMAKIESSPKFKAKDPVALERFYQLRYTPFYRDRANAGKLPYYFTQTTAERVLEYPMLMMRDFKQQDVLSKLGKISAPTLVVHSELDPLPIGFSQLIADGIKNSQLLLVNDVSHFGLIEDPDIYWDKVVPFLTKNAA